MGWRKDEATAYGNALAGAERHMSQGGTHPESGPCWQCSHFVECECSDEVPAMTARLLDYCGLCMAEEDDVTGLPLPLVVDRHEMHAWADCWTPAD